VRLLNVDRVGPVVLCPSFASLLVGMDGQGRDFERLCKWVLENAPEFKNRFREVFLWSQWPGCWGPDRGIDLVAITFDERVVAVQAKNYGPEHSITKRDIDTFLSESNRKGIHERLLMASTDRLAKSAREVMREQDKPVQTWLLDRMDRADVQWPAEMAVLDPAPEDRKEPRKHQREVLEAIERWACTDARRGQVVMACGTGKSLVAVWAADRLTAGRVLVLVPTLALLRQTVTTWSGQAATGRRVLEVASGTADSDSESIVRGDELSGCRTTDSSVVRDHLDGADPVLVVCTYDSSTVVAEAMAGPAIAPFDLVVADEAHRCAGFEDRTHKIVLDGDAIRAGRRLFFTATPTIFGLRARAAASRHNVALASMDDHSRFGAVVHHLSFSEAIERDLLCPYQVAVIPVSDADVHEMIKRRRLVTADGNHVLEAAHLATQLACARAMKRFGCRRMVAFQPSIKESRRFVDHFPVAVEMLAIDEQPAKLWVEHIDGDRMPVHKRASLRRHFESDGEEYRLLSNVKLLAEGVDVPGIDAIGFIDTHRGQVAIIQAVGRAVRKAPGKEIGTIILPVILRDGESFEAAMARSEHRGIVNVLGALRSHDPEIVRSLDELRFDLSPGLQRPKGHGRFVIDAPAKVGEDFAEAVDVALTRSLGVEAQRPLRHRRKPQAVVVAEPEILDEDQLFLKGLYTLESLARWELLPRLPDTTADFPLDTWWEEVKRRWLTNSLDPYDAEIIAGDVSWLAPGLGGRNSLLRRRMAWTTKAGPPEQVLAQLRPGGVLEAGGLAPLAEEGRLTDLLDPFIEIHDAVSHAAMPPGDAVGRLIRALEPLAAAVTQVERDNTEPLWRRDRPREAAVEGFRHRLREIRAEGLPDPVPNPSWLKGDQPNAFGVGASRAELLRRFIETVRPFKFVGEVQAVTSLREDERGIPADERLDELGWSIYMLVRGRGGADPDARSQALDGNYYRRKMVRRDLLRRPPAWGRGAR